MTEDAVRNGRLLLERVLEQEAASGKGPAVVGGDGQDRTPGKLAFTFAGQALLSVYVP